MLRAIAGFVLFGLMIVLLIAMVWTGWMIFFSPGSGPCR